MYNLDAYIYTNSGDKCNIFVKAIQEEMEDVVAVRISGVSRLPINSDFGGAIEFEIPEMKCWVADYRHSEFWCSPAFGEKYADIPDETQGLIYETKKGAYGVILPVVSEKYKCVLCGGENVVCAKMYSWYDKLYNIEGLAFVYSEGNNPFELLEKCAHTASKILNNGVRTRTERKYPDIFEYLGWCSWDAFGIRVTEKNILDKCSEFQQKNIPIKWMILDDMWGYVKDFHGREYTTPEEKKHLMFSSKLYSNEADPVRFPQGLKSVVNKIKEFGMKVGIWFPTTGYWRGIDPEGELFKDVKEYLLQADNGMYVPDYKQGNAYMYYDHFNSFFRKCGADFVKIDNQSMTRRFYKGKDAIGKVASQFHNAMEASVGQNFAGTMINCMGMASEDMWNRSISPISRCSDDFLPENKAWFTKHIMQCSYNCLIQGQFYYCDWDMWWTDDAQGIKNSILRAISGGPIYVSDQLDRSKASVLWPLILEDGKILRCDSPAMPTVDSLLYDPRKSGKLFKLQNICNGCGVLATFNLDEDEQRVRGTISPKDIEGMEGERFAVYEHFSKEMVVLNKKETFSLELANADEYKLYIIVPLNNGYGVIGRIDKYISPKTIKEVKEKEITLVEDGTYAYVENEKLVIKRG